MKIGFVGLGTMGAPMATRLAAADYEVVGWDVAVAGRERFAPCAKSLEAAIKGAAAIVTMLPEGTHVAEVYDSAVFRHASPGALLLDCSTIDVASSQRLATEAAARGYDMVDAPVSGGQEGAVQGTLSFMVGGSDQGVDSARPLLDTMGTKVTYFGPAGSGQAAKACHNMICGVTALGICEAFALAGALGLDADKFFSLCKGAAAQSWILENRCPVPGPAPHAPSSHDYAPGFTARLMAKDLNLAQQAAAASGQATPFGAEAARRFTEFAEAGGGDLDFSAIFRTIRNRTPST